MITPVLITSIGWGTYLFFGALNALFFPVIYFLYPETAGRSLEEIDLIFAKGYSEGIGYVQAAKQLPPIEESEIEQYARQFGGDLSDEEKAAGSFKQSKHQEELMA